MPPEPSDFRSLSQSHDDTQVSRPVAFLDRDGVINVDFGYVFRTEDLEFTPTAVDGIRLLNREGYRVIVATNQSGVARGYFSMDDVNRFHTYMNTELARKNAHIDAFYFCPYHPEGTVRKFAFDHPDRKPKPGMLLRAMIEWRIRRDRSFLIGDKASDLAAAKAAGLPGVMVLKDRCDLAAVLKNWLRA